MEVDSMQSAEREDGWYRGESPRGMSKLEANG